MTITLTREEAQRVLDALVNWDARGRLRLIETLRTRLAQSESEPVAWLIEFENGEQELHFVEQSVGEKQSALYTAPPQREWQGLTDEEMQDCIKTADYNQGQYKRTPYWAHLATAIEAKLKEKNT